MDTETNWDFREKQWRIFLQSNCKQLKRTTSIELQRHVIQCLHLKGFKRHAIAAKLSSEYDQDA
jgi:hypothetical protein